MIRSEYKYTQQPQQEGNRKAYPCRIFVAGKAPLARRPCSPLFYLHSPPTPRSSCSTTRSPTSSSSPRAGLPAPPPPRYQRAQREGGRGDWGRETNGASEAGAAARREASEGDGGDRATLLCRRLFPPASRLLALPADRRRLVWSRGRRTSEKWAVVAVDVVGFIGWAD
jgi:hypothetical protein